MTNTEINNKKTTRQGGNENEKICAKAVDALRGIMFKCSDFYVADCSRLQTFVVVYKRLIRNPLTVRHSEGFLFPALTGYRKSCDSNEK